MTLLDGQWVSVRDGDPRAKGLQARHYSAHLYRDGRRPLKIMGPGEYLLLMTVDCRALFGWRLSIWREDGQSGVSCTIFRNEGALRSSDLIGEADAMAWQRWPEQPRHYTYVNAAKVSSPNPGYCFKRAGWVFVGKSPGGLHLLERVRL